jgi:hypothetical protein
MMTVSEPHRIDIVARDPNGKIVLAMCEAREWGSSPWMGDQLKEKIQNYIAFVRSEDYKKEFGDGETNIVLMASYEPPEEIKELLDKVASSEGIEISYKVIPTRGLW